MALTHIALESDWAAAQQSGTYTMSTLGQQIAEVGFMHCSGSDEQLTGVRERFYATVTEPLMILTIDEQALAEYGLEVRWEPPVPGVPVEPATELFPHIYGGGLPLACVSSASAYS